MYDQGTTTVLRDNTTVFGDDMHFADSDAVQYGVEVGCSHKKVNFPRKQVSVFVGEDRHVMCAFCTTTLYIIASED